MPEYIYLLENRLSAAQKHALTQVREAAREAGTTVFLAGGAVRDLTTGSSVRNLDFSVQGNALEMEALLTARGAELWGKHEPTRTLTLWFPGSVRVSVASARSEEYPKPGKPVYHWSTIVEDLKRRDFTANAMALSLNEGSYGLLLDPLNGVADIEARLLRLASNYGFIEDPSRLVRATRLGKRLGWQMDEKTATRYANAKEAEAITAILPYLRGYELERIASEEDALVMLKALEAEGWMQHLMPAWTSAKADVAGLENLRRNWIQLLMQGVVADLTAAQLILLTASMSPDEVHELKQAMVDPGLVRHWEALDESAKEFGRLLTAKTAATPSATWKLLTTHAAEPVLWLAHTRKAGAVDTKFKNFFTVWPEFRKKVPAALMLEMRITPELPGYPELLEQLFYQLIDGNLETDEQMRAFLEPYSPPAPPPPPTVRRSRAKKSESKTKRRTAAPDDDDEDVDDDDEDADEIGSDDDEDEEEPEDEALTAALDTLHGDREVEDVDDVDEDKPLKAASRASDDDEDDEEGGTRKSKGKEDEDEDEVDAAPRAPAKKSAKAAAKSSAASSGTGGELQDEGAPPRGKAKAIPASKVKHKEDAGTVVAVPASAVPGAGKPAAAKATAKATSKAAAAEGTDEGAATKPAAEKPARKR